MMLNQPTPMNLILASASPRRSAFLEALRVPFVVHVAGVDEESADGEPPGALVARLSRAKAMAVARRRPQAAVIGADTIVALDGALLGKPTDPADAAAMLRRLCGRAHQVYSGVTLVAGDGSPQTTVVGTTAWARDYAEGEIEAYVASGAPLDKAGAYGIQDESFRPVSRLRGCYASVMGLPLCALAALLCPVGLAPPVDVAATCSALTGVPCCGGEDVLLELDGPR